MTSRDTGVPAISFLYPRSSLQATEFCHTSVTDTYAIEHLFQERTKQRQASLVNLTLALGAR